MNRFVEKSWNSSLWNTTSKAFATESLPIEHIIKKFFYCGANDSVCLNKILILWFNWERMTDNVCLYELGLHTKIANFR